MKITSGQLLRLEVDLAEASGAAEMLLAALKRAISDAPKDIVLPDGVQPRSAEERLRAHADLMKRSGEAMRALRASLKGFSALYYCGMLAAEVLDQLAAVRNGLVRDMADGLKKALFSEEAEQ